jgi:hypothetical protein
VATKYSAEHWRARAAEALAIAEEMVHAQTKATMLGIAEAYYRMARQAEQHEATMREIEDKSLAPKDG